MRLFVAYAGSPGFSNRKASNQNVAFFILDWTPQNFSCLQNVLASPSPFLPSQFPYQVIHCGHVSLFFWLTLINCDCRSNSCPFHKFVFPERGRCTPLHIFTRRHEDTHTYTHITHTTHTVHTRRTETHSQAHTDTDTDTRHQTPDTRHQTPDTRHQTPDTRHQTPDTRHQTPDTRHQTPDTRHQTPDTRHQTPDTRHQTPDTRHQTPHTATQYTPPTPHTPHAGHRHTHTTHTTHTTSQHIADTQHTPLHTQHKKLWLMPYTPWALTGVVFFFSCFAMAGLATVAIQMPEI